MVDSRAKVECSYFLDVLSQWCLIADSTLRDLQAKHSQLDVSLRFVPIAFKDPLPVTRAEQARAYERSAMITGVRTVPWIVEGEPTHTWEANATVLAGAHLGLDVERVRGAIAHAALIEGQPMGREGAAIALVSRQFGVDAKELQHVVYGAEIAARMQAQEDAFKALHLQVRPTFVLRNAIEDHVILGGTYRFDLLDTSVQCLSEDAAGYAHFEEIGA